MIEQLNAQSSEWCAVLLCILINVLPVQEFKKGFGSYDYDNKSQIDNRELKCSKKAAGNDNIW